MKLPNFTELRRQYIKQKEAENKLEHVEDYRGVEIVKVSDSNVERYYVKFPAGSFPYSNKYSFVQGARRCIDRTYMKGQLAL